MVSNLDIAKKYADDILSGSINACKYIKQACNIFKQNLERTDLYINEDEIDQVVRFINNLELIDDYAGQPFILQPFQTFILANIYGFYYTTTNKRKHRYIYLELPRKNAKSMLIDAICTYHLVFDTDSQIVLTANSRDQVKKVNFKQVKAFCDQLDPARKHIKRNYLRMACGDNELIVTASDADKVHGLNVAVGVVDELHSSKNGNMYNVIKSSMGSRQNPILLVITTAGDDTDSFCYQMRTYVTEILSGEKTDDSQFSLIYTLDDGDDYTIEENWYKANPGLDVSVTKDFYVSEIVKAMNNPVETNGVKQLNFNIWLPNKGKEEKYIDMQYVKASMKDIDINDEMFAGFECWVGGDLGITSDITAVVTMIQLDDYFYFFPQYFIPEKSDNSSSNVKQFKEWATQGYINITDGNVADYQNVTKFLLDLKEKRDVRQVTYDPANSSQWAIEASQDDLYLMPYPQTNVRMNMPTKELSRLIMSDRVRIQYNPVTEWMFNNVIIRESGNLIRPDKAKKGNKIDGVAAMITCLAGYINNSRGGFGIL